jgi:uncharacterized protein (DUF58 family)
MLLVDMSASTAFGTAEAAKREAAAEIAGVLAFNALRNSDKVGAILFTDQVETYIPPKKGAAHIWRVIKEIFTHEPRHRQTDIDGAVRYLNRVCRKKTVSFLISDFLDDAYQQALRITSRKHELIGVYLSDPGDFRLPEAGIITVEDFETGRTRLLDASNGQHRMAFARNCRRQQSRTLDNLKTADIDCVPISTEDDVADGLARYFRYREKRIR